MCVLGVVVGLSGSRTDDVEAELPRPAAQLGAGHERILPVKAIRIHEDGGPEVLRYEDVPDPEPGPGEVLVALRAAASTTSTSGCGRACRRCRSRASSERTVPASWRRSATGTGAFAVGDRVVINPGIEHGGRITVIGEHTDGTHCELIAIAGRAAASRSTTRCRSSRRRRSRSSTRPRTGCS